jgi:hypothetical protein
VFTKNKADWQRNNGKPRRNASPITRRHLPYIREQEQDAEQKDKNENHRP